MSLDPDLQRLLQAMPTEFAVPVDWAAARASAKAVEPMLAGPRGVAPVHAVRSRQIDGPGGPLELRVYYPAGAPAMTMIHFHGGGWTLGDLDTCDHTVRKMCNGLNAIVVSCTYRKAPEHPFPAAFDDALAQTRWVLAHVAELGGDPQRVVIAGDSAGGNLITAVTIALRDQGRRDMAALSQPLPSLRAQLVMYPGVDVRPSARQTASFYDDLDPSLPVAAIAECIAAYVQNGEVDDWRASPLAADDLSLLPPALVVVLTVDPLRDQGVAYAARLRQAGVPCELLEFPHLTHGFMHIAELVPAAARAFDQVIERFDRFAALGARP